MNRTILGIENLDKHLDFFKDKRVGLITNPTGITGNFENSIDILRRRVNLTMLLAPEHGVRASIQAGVHVDSYFDDETGILVQSIYGKNKKPGKEIMENLDVIALDIQDNGSRYYTFIYSMAYCMIACKEFDKEFVVFDRPNPIDGEMVEGNFLDIEKYRSFVGYYSMPQRHGMTIGELALLFNEEYGINCKLKVIKMENWERWMTFDDTHLPWVLPTPNIPTINTCFAYNATCIFEGTNFAEGRGTTTPFELIGAPWINASKFAKELNDLNIHGVHFRPQYFTPTFSKYKDELCGGVYLHITDRKIFNSVIASIKMLHLVRNNYSEFFKINEPYVEGKPSLFHYEAGTDEIIYDLGTIESQVASLEKDALAFANLRKKYLLY